MAKKGRSRKESVDSIDIKDAFQNSAPGIWMLIGLVGSGKTTFAQHVWATDPKGTVRSSLDEIIQMMSFYHYDTKMSNFYGGIERSAIIEGLLDGYKVIIDRTNITKKIRGQFITLVKNMHGIAKDFLGLFSALEKPDFFEQCEKSLIEQILLDESKKNISIYTAFLKIIRDWKAKSTQPSLFSRDPSPIKKQLHAIMQIEIVGIYFAVPEKVCIQRRRNDPRNALRDITSTVNWQGVIKRMVKQLQPPEMDEGFDRLYSIDEEGAMGQFS